MGRLVDIDDLVDSTGAADLLSLSHRNSVYTYAKRYKSFPQPVLDLGSRRCRLWLRSEIQEWIAARSAQ